MQKKPQFKRYGLGARAARSMNGDGIFYVPFHRIGSLALVAGAQGQTLTADSFGNRLTSVADAYGMYRIEKLAYRLTPNSTITVMQSMCFYPGVIDTLPTTVTTNSESPHATFMAIRQVVNSDWVRLSRKAVETYFPWLKSKAGSLDASEEQVGSFAFTGTGTETVTYEMRGVLAFRLPVDTGSTPLSREIRDRNEKLAMKKRLLDLLSYSETAVVVSTKLAPNSAPGAG